MNDAPYTNDELARLPMHARCARGPLCPKCGCHIPSFAVLTAADEASLRRLDTMSAIREVRAKTGCSVAFAKIWALHPDGPCPRKEGPPCPYCGQPLFTSLSKQCLRCGWDWHDAARPVQHILKKAQQKGPD